VPIGCGKLLIIGFHLNAYVKTNFFVERMTGRSKSNVEISLQSAALQGFLRDYVGENSILISFTSKVFTDYPLLSVLS
jgi:hypothetical protein